MVVPRQTLLFLVLHHNHNALHNTALTVVFIASKLRPQLLFSASSTSPVSNQSTADVSHQTLPNQVVQSSAPSQCQRVAAKAQPNYGGLRLLTSCIYVHHVSSLAAWRSQVQIFSCIHTSCSCVPYYTIRNGSKYMQTSAISVPPAATPPCFVAVLLCLNHPPIHHVGQV